METLIRVNKKDIRLLLEKHGSELKVDDIKDSLQMLHDFCISCSAKEIIENCSNEVELRIFRTSKIKERLSS